MSSRKRGYPVSIISIIAGLIFLGLLWAAGWGDLNDDGRRDAGDAALLLRRLVGLEDELPAQGTPEGLLAVHFIDVGQGDSILIRTPQGRTMLIDGGTAAAGETVLNYLSRAGISKIDLVVGTHPHEDHIGGLVSVLEKMPVDRVIDSGKIHTSQTYEKYLTLIEKKKIPFEIGRAGQKINLDPAVVLKILHPGPDVERGDANHASVVIELRYGRVTFLFNGDAEERAEAEILERGYHRAGATILKAGHHGSSTSTSESFLKAVAPAAAVISAGRDNPYGHPHAETLDRLAASRVKIYRTDLLGSIVIVSDGSGYTINTADTGPAAD